VNWVDQKVIDGAVNGVGTGAAEMGRFTYDVLDQKVVDGAVNGLAVSTGETGGLLRYIQSGRVQRYALMLFAAVALLSLALLIFS
jgi:NADH-quinone oxidoreductase subunit L